MTPYTIHSVQQIRSLCNRGWPPGAVAITLGWDLPFLKKICDRHGIKFPEVKKKTIQDFELSEVGWDGKKVSFRGRSVSLLGTEARIFSYVYRTPGAPRTLMGIEREAHVTKRNVVPGIERARTKLEKLGLTLSRWGYDIELA